MLIYCPMATIKGQEEPLFSYDSCLTENEACQVINSWSNQYNLEKAWIDCFDENSNKTIIEVLS